jgi:hypothetical protein
MGPPKNGFRFSVSGFRLGKTFHFIYHTQLPEKPADYGSPERQAAAVGEQEMTLLLEAGSLN